MRTTSEDLGATALARWTRAMIRYRWAVIAAWIAILVGSALAMQDLGDLLTNRFTLPGTDTRRAEQILQDHFAQRSAGSFIVVAEAPDGGIAALVPELEAAGKAAAGAIPTGTFVAVTPVSSEVASITIASNLEPADAKGWTDDMRAALPAIDGVTLSVTGQAAVEHDLAPIQEEDLQRGEFFIAVPIALLILVAVFGTLAFLLPFMFAISAIPATLGVVWVFASFMELSTYVTQLVSLIGLGIAIDYSLLIVYRYREERRAGRDKTDAIVATMETAGRAVVFSGTAVAIGLAMLLAMPLPFMRGFGLAGLTIPIVSVVCALTLMPALLYFTADGLDRVRLVPKRMIEARDEGRFWVGLARRIMRRPALYATLAVGLLVAAAIPAFWIEVGPGTNQGIPQNLESTRALAVLGDAAGQGATAPTELIVDTGRKGGADDPAVSEAVQRLEQGLRRDPETVLVVNGEGAQFVDATGRYLRLQAIGESEYGTREAMDFVDRLRGEIVPAAAFPSGVSVYAGGGPPSSVDFLDLTYGTFPWLVLAVLALTYVLLLRAFRSVLLPLKAILLNLLSIGAAYGLLVIVFKWGAGEPFGLQSYDQIEGWIPVFLFAMLFGLSMDYEVFLVTRMREEWDKGRPNADAVAIGLARTGRIVTAAGLIMIAAFSGFMAGRILGLQQFGFGLAVAIAVDVTIVRALLLPSAMALFGRWNWWLPERVAKLARVKASPLAGSGGAAVSPTGR
ncbi:MAG: MMPL family transporter [Gaiellales bacterium]